jgi:hypothetical protein
MSSGSRLAGIIIPENIIEGKNMHCEARAIVLCFFTRQESGAPISSEHKAMSKTARKNKHKLSGRARSKISGVVNTITAAMMRM